MVIAFLIGIALFASGSIGLIEYSLGIRNHSIMILGLSKEIQIIHSVYEICIGGLLIATYLTNNKKMKLILDPLVILTLLLFSTFLVVLLIFGIEKCGCMGRLSVPIPVVLIFDLCSVTLFISQMVLRKDQVLSRKNIFACTFAFSCFAILFGMYLSVQFRSDSYVRLLAHQLTTEQTIILKPLTWKGKQFPLNGYLNGGDRLKSGDWDVVLVDPECKTCREKVRELAKSDSKSKIAVIVLGTADKRLSSSDEKISFFYLQQNYRFISKVPLQFRLIDNIVLE